LVASEDDLVLRPRRPGLFDNNGGAASTAGPTAAETSAVYKPHAH